MIPFLVLLALIVKIGSVVTCDILSASGNVRNLCQPRTSSSYFRHHSSKLFPRIRSCSSSARRITDRHRRNLRNMCQHGVPATSDRELFPEKFVQRTEYDCSKSTHEIYAVNSTRFAGPFSSSREKLDYSYHSNYEDDRRRLQDRIILNILKEQGRSSRKYTKQLSLCNASRWIVFTAGAMGSGKGYTMKWLARKNLFPLSSFIWVDPDEIREKLPEWNGYIEACPLRAARLTNRETGMISEILVQEALRRNHNVLIDGTMRDYQWYTESFLKLRKHFPEYRIAIVYIKASLDKIKDRVKRRARSTGRVVPEDAINDSFVTVPTSIRELTPSVDFLAIVSNDIDDGEPVLTSPKNPEIFRRQWFAKRGGVK